jgi:DNA replication protein DnaC
MRNTFEAIKPVKGIGEAVKLAKLLTTLETEWTHLLIYGENGNGKTMILEAISIHLYGRGYYAPVHTFPDFMGKLKASFDRSKAADDQSFETIIQRVCTAPFLLMDDVGQADSYTDWSKKQLERIMLARYRTEGMITVMTTNKDISELPVMVLSRFSDTVKSRMVLNAAEDYRPKKKVSK